MKKLSLIFFSVLLTACGTMRLQVKAPYKSSKGNGTIVYERSYWVGNGLPVWCPLTIIFYGGACWAYLGKPFHSEEKRLVKDATHDVNTMLGSTDVVLESPKVKRLSWGSADTFISL